MTLDILLASALLLALIVLAHAIIDKRKPSYPPQVPSTFPWIGSLVSFTLRPGEFLTNCISQYGPVFKLLLGGRQATFVSSKEALQSFFAVEHGLLSPRTQSHTILRMIGCGASRTQKLYAFGTQELFPILDKRLAKRTLGDLTPGFADVLFNRLKRFANYNGSLRRSLTEPLYVVTNAILLGSRFSPDTYDDYMLFSGSLHPFSARPLWPFPSIRARKRLLGYISKYIEDLGTDKEDSLGTNLFEAFQKHNLTNEDGASLILVLTLTIHMNLFNVVFWLFAWLLADPSALAAVRDEIDKTVREEFGSIHGFLVNASPENLQPSSFALLHSAILEALRLSSLVIGIRDAERDIELKDGKRVIPIRKGELVVAVSWAAHRDEGLYPDGHRFIADRFVQNRDEDIVQNLSKSFFSFNGGKHPCKGRLLAVYEMKVLAIIYFSLFDVTPVPQEYGSSKWKQPQSSAQSAGLPSIFTTEDITVKLRPRFDF